LTNNTVHKPGIDIVAMLPVPTQMADDIPVDFIGSKLEQLIRERFERAHKRRSRGPYALGPISQPVRKQTDYYFIRDQVAFYSKAEVLNAGKG